SWEQSGGDGSIYECNGLLVVKTTPAIQWEIAELLTGLDAAIDAYDRDELVVYRQQLNPYAAAVGNARSIHVYRTGRDRPASWASSRLSQDYGGTWDVGTILTRQLNDDVRAYEDYASNSEISIESHEFFVLSCTEAEHELAERYLQLVTRPANGDDWSVVTEGAWELLTLVSSNASAEFVEAQRDLSDLHHQLRVLPAHPHDAMHADVALSLDLRLFLARGLSRLPFSTSTLIYADWLWIRTDSPEHLAAARTCIDQQLVSLATVLEGLNNSSETTDGSTIADHLLGVAIDDATSELNDSAAWLLAVAGERCVTLSADSVQMLADNSARIAPDLRWPVLQVARTNDPRDIAPLIPLLTDNLRTRTHFDQLAVIQDLTDAGVAAVPALCKLITEGSYDLEIQVVAALKHIAERDERALPLIFASCLHQSHRTQQSMATAFANLPQYRDQLRTLIEEYDRNEDPGQQQQWKRFRAQLQFTIGADAYEVVVFPELSNDGDSPSSDAAAQP
ncbi:MAG: hypothetical protein KDB23_27835, partial [Planctomycetales bacterium]|nr:hypothetical protein [Planctomycetales bacterium]